MYVVLMWRWADCAGVGRVRPWVVCSWRRCLCARRLRFELGHRAFGAGQLLGRLLQTALYDLNNGGDRGSQFPLNYEPMSAWIHEDMRN